MGRHHERGERARRGVARVRGSIRRPQHALGSQPARVARTPRDYRPESAARPDLEVTRWARLAKDAPTLCATRAGRRVSDNRRNSYQCALNRRCHRAELHHRGTWGPVPTRIFHWHHVAAFFVRVFHNPPGQGIAIGAHAWKSAKFDHGIANLAGPSVDYEFLPSVLYRAAPSTVSDEMTSSDVFGAAAIFVRNAAGSI
jgi:hypothetical protein